MTSEQRVGGAALVQDIIQTFISDSSQNNLQNQNHEKAFDQALVGFSSGDDPLYEDSYQARCFGRGGKLPTYKAGHLVNKE